MLVSFIRLWGTVRTINIHTSSEPRQLTRGVSNHTVLGKSWGGQDTKRDGLLDFQLV